MAIGKILTNRSGGRGSIRAVAPYKKKRSIHKWIVYEVILTRFGLVDIDDQRFY